MDSDNDLLFVLKHYRNGKLDAVRAYRQFRERTGQTARQDGMQDTAQGGMQDTTQGGMRRAMMRAGGIRTWAAAAVLLVLLAAGAAFWLRRPLETRYASGGTPLLLTLADGTVVTLQPHSSLTFRGDSCRRLHLQGSALFRVRHDAHRPFLVTGRFSGVRVLGTAFALSERAGRADVSVYSGRIRFMALHAGTDVVMTRGMKAHLYRDGRRPVVTQRPSWPERHSFRFSDTPLDEVLHRLSACYDVRLTLRSGSADKRLTARFNAAALTDILPMIEQVLDVRIAVEEP